MSKVKAVSITTSQIHYFDSLKDAAEHFGYRSPSSIARAIETGKPTKDFVFSCVKDTALHWSVLNSPSMKGKYIGDFEGPCVYLLRFKYRNGLAVKFGASKDFKKRVSEHLRTYPQLQIWCILECKNLESAVKTELSFKHRIRQFMSSIKLPEDGKKQHTYTEILLDMTIENAEIHLKEAWEKVNLEIISTDANLLELENKKLDIRKLELEVEKYNLLMKLNKIGIDV